MSLAPRADDLVHRDYVVVLVVGKAMHTEAHTCVEDDKLVA